MGGKDLIHYVCICIYEGSLQQKGTNACLFQDFKFLILGESENWTICHEVVRL